MLRRLNLFQYFLPCCLLGVVLLGLGGKLWLIRSYGTPVPDDGQWQAGVPALAPDWAAGNVVLSHVDNPVELPILARAVLGALIHANHQWDDRVTNIVGALLLVVTFATVLAAGARRLGWTAVWASALCGGLLLALPLDWNQSLAGSALSDRLTLFLGFPAVWMLFDRDLRSPLWLPAAGALLLAQTASDWAVALPMAVGAVAGARILTNPSQRSRDTAALAVALLGIGIHTGAFLDGGRLHFPAPEALATSLSDPWIAQPWASTVIFAPLFVRLGISLRDRDRKHSQAPLAAVVIAGGLGVVWMVARNGPARVGEARAIVLLLTALSFASLTQLWHLKWQSVMARAGISLAWVAVLVSQLDAAMETAVARDLPRHAMRNEVEREAIAGLIAGADQVAGGRPASDLLSQAQIDRLRVALDSPRVRQVLPYCLQQPLPVLRSPSTSADFAPWTSGDRGFAAPRHPAWIGGPAAEGTGGALLVSQPLPASARGILRFEVAGDLGTEAFPFGLRSVRTGAYSPLELTASTGERWRTVNLPRPDEPVVIVAGPAALGAWGAFTHPVEMGTWSWIATKLTKHWAWFSGCGIVCFGLALLLPFAPRAVRRDTFALAPDGRIVLVAENDDS